MVINCTHLVGVLEEYYLSPAYALEFALGFPSNLLVVLGYVFCLPEWRSINVYLFNLAMSDLIFLCTLPRLSYLYATHKLEPQPFICILNRYILHVNLYSSIVFMVWVSADRLLLIRHPARCHILLSRRAALWVSALTWVVVNLQVTPLVYFMVQDLQRGNWSHCQDFASLDADTLGYSLGLTVTGYLFPLLGLGFFSHRIARLLFAQEGAVEGRTTSFRKPLRMVTAVAAMFSVIYTPYHLMRNMSIASRRSWAGLSLCSRMYIQGTYILTRPLAFAHSVINPIFYFLVGDKFRELLLAKFRGLVRKTQQYRGCMK